jgi:hypothetical protein
MAKLLLVCHRDRTRRLDPELLRKLSKAIIPDNIEPCPPRMLDAPGLDIGVFNPNGAVLIQHASVCLGNLIDPGSDWGRTHAPRPDGSYALFRADDRCVELVSDACASRTLWYVLTDDLFVASTSQRAIVTVLGSYHPNRDAIAWMLSAGNLGPGLSWDSRIRCVPGNARVVLDRAAWTLLETRERIEFAPRQAPDRAHREEFIRALREVFGQLRIDYETWYLMLSGGLDSRCILLMLENKAGLRSVTWGLASALGEPKSDAVVARELADHFGIAHEYYTTDISAESIDTVFDRLLVAGEGRTSTISAYMDGSQIWSRLFSTGIAGVIRGDVVFSPYRVYSEQDVRRIDGAMFLRDYDNLSRFGSLFGERQYWPDHLHRRQGETLSTWRDRLTYEYRCPVIWAALNEIKSSFVEVMNPLLSHRVLDVIVTLPDHLRDGRSMYSEIVRDLSPKIDFAEHNAIENTAGILASPAVVRHLYESLDSVDARALLSNELIAQVLENIAISPVRRVPRSHIVPKFVKRLVPERLRMYKKRLTQSRSLDINLLALRAYIVVAMDRRLKADARAFASKENILETVIPAKAKIQSSSNR